jgi:oxygen-independent coproporphyrinogen-3 oxidase
MQEDYCRIVVSEIRERTNCIANQTQPLTSLFYGGGTPGYIAPEYLARIHECVSQAIGIEEAAELSLETTPHSITLEKAKSWLAMGINRLSIGLESLNDNELVTIGRDHTVEQALKGVEIAREAGFKNISVDLVYGLPTQTLESWEQTLDSAISLEAPHLSAYGLTLAGNSPLLNRFPRQCPDYPDEDLFSSMYALVVSKCEAAGLAQYEISNFSRPGFESRHNLTYWANDEYFGFGVSAHRYLDGVRTSNLRSLKRYMHDYMADETREVIDYQTRAKEAVFLGLRLRSGIDLALFKERYGVDLEDLHCNKITRLKEGGFLELSDGHLRLSQQGVLVSNLVMSELV